MTVQPAVAAPNRGEVDFHSIDLHDDAFLGADPEADVRAGVDGRPLGESPLPLGTADHDRAGVVANDVGHCQLAAGEPTDDAALHPEHHRRSAVAYGQRPVLDRRAHGRRHRGRGEREDGRSRKQKKPGKAHPPSIARLSVTFLSDL